MSKFQMAPKLILLKSSSSKKKFPDTRVWVRPMTCTQKLWAKVSSFTAHLLHKGLSSSPNMWRCLFIMLCPVGRPVEILDWVLFKDKNLALAARLGPKINSQACLWVPSRPHHLAQCWSIYQRLSLLCILCLDSQSRLRSEKPQNRATPHKLISDLISSYTSMSGTQKSPTACQVEISFNVFWHCWTKGDVLMAQSAFSTAWLSEQILTFFSSLFWNWIP